MAGKKGKNSSKGSHGGPKADVVQDDRLQAIVLTDSFETRFMPLTSEKPRCLLPLANVPLIEYTLEFLAKAGVNEVYLVCSSHASKIDEYIEDSKWNLPWSPFKVTTLMSPEARSVGDAMRDLDNRGIITGDFILVSGDVVTNIEFDKVLEFHKRMHSKDKDHIVTMCLAKASQFHKTRTFEPAAFILDQSNNRCLYYQDIPSSSSKAKTEVEIDSDLLEDVDDFVIRNDLIDCRIDICSPLVPAVFQENFDYQMLRSDFIKGVLTSDLLSKHVYAYVTEEYANRVVSWKTYDTITQDFIGRWCYPLVLDSNVLSDQTYSYESGHIYKERDIMLAQSCKIGKNTAIGSKTKIGEGTTIENSVIGRNCQIGENIVIKNSYVWDNAVIGNNSIIDHCIVASNATLRDNVILNDGCIVGYNVFIDSNMEIPNGTKISGQPVKSMHAHEFGISDDEEETIEEQAKNSRRIITSLAVNLVGPKGIGYVYDSDISDNDEDSSDSGEGANALSYRLEEFYLSDDSISSKTFKSKKKRTMSTNSMYTDREENASELDEDEDFEVEGIETVKRAIENNHDLDTALLELNTLRMSMNVTYHEVRTATVIALLRRVYHFIATQTLAPKQAVTKVFGQWGLLFRRQAFEHEEFLDLMNIIIHQTLAIGFEKPDLVLFSSLSTLYDNDILEEDIIYEWWEQVSTDPAYNDINKLTAKWIEWLKQADEESSEEGDSEDGESETDEETDEE
ncbi:hypothetical protein HG535_0F04650 [Zygotorulaspora mrakii]|uniref:Translation initiation factor eIF2B subunit epsilon n=1 Tax=Zygotorulaspora mrakii TaxID=42260 RepID=A0A7H9B623_ZYGMR|nr:uncharacterized protein HG535_0F04650 [Zygotorulaspora mrakii]QLG73953.1 hypothetical protein HG535_0F04650 [Zygotorulaspora mrakii]